MHYSAPTVVTAVFLVGMRLLIAGIFIRAGIVKLVRPGRFRRAVANYDIVPAALVGVTAGSVPVVEAAAGLLLLLGVWPGVVAAILAALLVCFAAVITVNLARDRVFDCGCGGYGAAPTTIGWRHVLVNMLLAGAAVAISAAPPEGLNLLHGPRGVFSVGIPPGAGTPVLLATALVFLTARMLGAAVVARGLLRRP